MSTQVSVPVGSSATLIASGFSGLVINTDSKNAVWLSSSPSVQAGQGVPLQPLGSANWNQGGPIYGVVASGVTSPVTLNLSTESTNVDNPVAVGSAVAAQLLSQGVPSVLVGGQVTPPPDGYWQVGAYASLSLNLLTSGNGTILIQFYPKNSSNPVYAERYTVGQGINGFEIITNVYGDVMTITSVGATLSVTNLLVYGSNRAIPRDKCIASTLMLNAGLTQVFNASTRYTLQSVVTPGGLATFDFRASAGLMTGTGVGSSFGFEYFDQIANQLAFQVIASNKAFQTDSFGNYWWNGQFMLPPGVISFQVSNDATANTVNSTAVMTGTLPN